jgi:hypothetical protein
VNDKACCKFNIRAGIYEKNPSLTKNLHSGIERMYSAKGVECGTSDKSKSVRERQ